MNPKQEPSGFCRALPRIVAASTASWGSGSRYWRRTALAMLAGDAILAAGLAAEGSILARPGGLKYLVAPLAALILYAVVVVFLTGRNQIRTPIVLRVGTVVGAVTGVMWVVSLAVETFAGLSGWPNVAATAPMLLGGFLVWGVAGGIAYRRSHSTAAGMLAAVCAAMLCVVVTVAFGFVLGFVAPSRLAHNIDGSPEYLASHWDDLHAFAIANTLDAAFTHLLLAPIIAALTGGVGALLANRNHQGAGHPSSHRSS